MEWLVSVSYKWYLIMSQLSNYVGTPLLRVIGGQNIPGLSALLLGLLGGLAPCQLSANAGAIAYVTQSNNTRKGAFLWRSVGAFIGGKATVYVVLGFLAAVLGLRIPNEALGAMRKLSGPLMLFLGLFLAGVFRWRGDLGARFTTWLEERTPRWGSPSYWLGLFFSLGFCPTMAMIFFGALIPIVVQASAGLLLPVIFAVGTSIPIMIWAVALSLGDRVAGRWLRGLRNLDRYVRWTAAAIFILLGFSDTILYWFA